MTAREQAANAVQFGDLTAGRLSQPLLPSPVPVAVMALDAGVAVVCGLPAAVVTLARSG